MPGNQLFSFSALLSFVSAQSVCGIMEMNSYKLTVADFQLLSQNELISHYLLKAVWTTHDG